jgi:ubiquinone/menaquinone biosynthesis C-methylase UbiE
VTVAILRDSGIHLGPNDKVLDFGCGDGRHVYEFRDRGFDARGVDFGHYARLRDAADDEFFDVAASAPSYRLPYSDAEFDFVHSTSVFEHVMDYQSALSEISRVLKHDGASLHVFPARWRPIEPHMFVPFGARIHYRSWFFVWALLGIRNQFQQGKGAKEVAHLNDAYSKNGINYLTKRQIISVASQFFTTVEFAEGAYIRHAPGRTRQLRPLLNLVPSLAGVYRAWHTRILLLRK